jgi:hypothetical protein
VATKDMVGEQARSILNTVVNAALPAVALGLPLVEISAGLRKSQSDLANAEKDGLAALEVEAKKQRVMMDFQAHQARVAQEMAIARRIELSTEVEIEEFYDESAKLNGGLKASFEGVPTVGLSANHESSGVTRRIYRFKGGMTQTVSSVEPIEDPR